MARNIAAPGRLGNSDLTLATDPRALPELVKVAQSMQLAGYSHGLYPDLSDTAALEKICRESHEGFAAVYESLPNDLPEDEGEAEVEESELTINGVDGNEIKLYVWKRKDSVSQPLPAVVYIHGGGMTILPTRIKPAIRWCKSLALLGTVAVAIDFRNAWTPEKHQPFPAGLNDCASAIQYLHTNKTQLGISTITIQGESGGSNLVLATALKANREGWVDAIAGVYANCPYISNKWGASDEEKLQELPSLIENEGYFLSVPMMSGMGKWYTPNDADSENPLAWPYYANEGDLKGLPPHILSMDELDPLRDEGMAYFRKLGQAGVKVTADVSLGTVHASAIIFRQALPEVHRKALRHIVAFAKSL